MPRTFACCSAVSGPCFRSLLIFCALRVALRFQLFGLGQRRSALGIELAELPHVELKPRVARRSAMASRFARKKD